MRFSGLFSPRSRVMRAQAAVQKQQATADKRAASADKKERLARRSKGPHAYGKRLVQQDQWAIDEAASWEWSRHLQSITDKGHRDGRMVQRVFAPQVLPILTDFSTRAFDREVEKTTADELQRHEMQLRRPKRERRATCPVLRTSSSSGSSNTGSGGASPESAFSSWKPRQQQHQHQHLAPLASRGVSLAKLQGGVGASTRHLDRKTKSKPPLQHRHRAMRKRLLLQKVSPRLAGWAARH